MHVENLCYFFLTKILHAFVYSTCAAHSTSLIILIIIHQASYYGISSGHLTMSSILDPNIFLHILFSNTPMSMFLPQCQRHVSIPYKTTSKIVVLYISITLYTCTLDMPGSISAEGTGFRR
jgi:hypothetical protein